MRILIVEDEEALAGGLQFNFEQEGYEAEVAGDGQTALDRLQQDDVSFDLVVLDLMLPGMSGYETSSRIRQFNNRIPILVLSARTLSEDKALAFDCGTDQYMTKPFALPELLSRVRNLLERRQQVVGQAFQPAYRSWQAGKPAPQSTDAYAFGDVRVDFAKYELTALGRTHNLTKMEFDLLRYFIKNEGNVLSRMQILRDVWSQSPDISTRSIDNFVMRLRKLVESNPAAPRHILSVRGTGYRFVAHPDNPADDNT